MLELLLLGLLDSELGYLTLECENLTLLEELSFLRPKDDCRFPSLEVASGSGEISQGFECLWPWRIAIKERS
jgi:hypothetical protein